MGYLVEGIVRLVVGALLLIAAAGLVSCQPVTPPALYKGPEVFFAVRIC